MRILIIGSGGREHALAYKIKQSSLCDELFCIKGNGGTEEIATNVCDIEENDFEGIISFCKKASIDLVIIGPETPLANGIVDTLENNGIKVFGPKKSAAKIEASKVFAKIFFKKYNIPTADFKVFDSYETALKFIATKNFPLVIKVDGLAQGKGVTVVKNEMDAKETLTSIFIHNKFGDAGKQVIIEDFLEGEEVSILSFVDGKNVLPLIAAQDHKQIYDGDRGPNTGGMGAYANAPIVGESLNRLIKDDIILKTMEGFSKEGIDYRGILYAGLMIKNKKPYILEYNCRFGDPETQAILPLMKSDILELFLASIHGELKNKKIVWQNKYSICVVLASGGYPDRYEKNKEIFGLYSIKDLDDILVFHAGTKKENGKFFTTGGRVMSVVAIDRDFYKAQKKVYDAISNISFDGMHFRKDIGNKARKYL